MDNFMNKASAVLAVILMIASVGFMTIVANPVQAQIPDEINIPHGGTPSATYGLPNLGPLPPGVTPQYTFTQTAYMSLTPNPIGIGQALLVNIWTSPGMYHAFYGQGYKVTFQKPDGTIDTVGPMNSYLGDDTSWFQYVADAVGTWKAKFEAPGTYIPAGVYVDRPGNIDSANYTLGASVWYTPCSTDWQEFTVQSDIVYSWPPAPLPTDYWTRPISLENREWWSIAGNFPWTGAYYYPNGRVLYSSNYQYTAYVQAPNTAHIVWKRQGNIAGLIGGEQYQYGLSAGSGTPNIIYSGRCYQTINKVVDGSPTSVWECYDLRTGEVYWDITGVTAPTNILYEPPGTSVVAGAEASGSYSVYLVRIGSGNLYKYNPYTGAASSTISLPSYITSGTIYNNEWVLSVQTINATANNYRLINWTMAGSSTNFTTRIATNITWPYSSIYYVDYDAELAGSVSWANPPGPQWCIGYDIWSIDLRTGTELFRITGNDTVETCNTGSTRMFNHGKVAFAVANRHWVCFDGRTGKKLWNSELTEYPWGNWWAYNSASYDFNETKSAIIATNYAGIYAIDWDNGKILWHYSVPTVPFENPYGTEPFFTGVVIADGKVYGYGGEHSPSQPITRGWHLHCVNATTGEGIWKITGTMTPGAVADGYLTASNSYDGYMYVFGRGKSATTITAPDVALPLGTAFTIKGNVLDQSPAQPGTPCVSKDSMQTQMEYLHMQHPIDGLWHNETITGVPVTLTAIGSDNSYYDLGTVTTNGYYGTFSKAWTPPNEDTYTIIAAFNSDDSYGSSSAATAVTVGPATPTPSTPDIPTPIDTTMVIIGTGIAIIIAVVIGFAISILILRKR